MRGFLFVLFVGLVGSWAVAQDTSGWAIVDAAKGLPVAAELTLEVPERTKPIASESAGFHGLPSGVDGKVHALVLEPQFLLHSEVYELPFAGTDTIALQPMKAGLRMDLPRVQFVEASFRLDFHSLLTLEYLVEFLAFNPTVELAISCTVQGTDAVSCERLGRQRARSVWEYLVTEGVAPTRLKLEGRCSEEEEPRIALEIRSI
jgi:hypothetical protein